MLSSLKTKIMKKTALFVIWLTAFQAFAQEKDWGIPERYEPENLKLIYEGNHRTYGNFKPANVFPTTGQELRQSVEKHRQMAENSIFKTYPIRNVGPTVMSGRVTDIAVHPKNSKIFYVAYASGGLFKTVNNGISFEPVFDGQAALGMGDIAISESNPDILWVGTGENNSSRSSYAGAGVFKSTDAGKTWTPAGLENTHHIGRVVIHPTNPDIVWVAAIGALYSTGKDRGLYKTSDGGRSWKKTIFIDDSTGVIDLIVNPKNPEQLWCATWQRLRSAGNFVGNGRGSAVYMSEDGGETWKKSSSGLPQNAFAGRIGLDISASQPNILYAVLDDQETAKKEKQETKEKKKSKFKPADFKNMTAAQFLNLPETDLDTFLLENNFPEKYKGKSVKEGVRKGKYLPKALSDYFGEANDANEALLNATIKGAEIYRSEDFGKTWKKVNEHNLDGVFNTYGYYFGQIRIDPQNPDRIFTWGVPLLVSSDGGRHFTLTDTTGNVHGDHHALWINPADNQHLINGNDGGVNMSYDGGKTWNKLNTNAVAQFYTVAVDNEKPYNIYGGLQDNGTYFGTSKPDGDESRPWKMLFGGDGMVVNVDTRNPDNLIAGFQYGNYYKISRSGKFHSKRLTPVHDIGETPLRFNWRTPVSRSVHNPDIIYFGSQKLHRSLDDGDTWQTISPDLTLNRKQGNVPYSTLTVIAESPLKFGLIYVGTDDGNIQLTRNGGASWELIIKGLPQNLWVSSLSPSPHDEAVVYAAMNGYRYDNFKSYVFKSIDYGKTWTPIMSNLPDESVNVLVQDAVNPALLYLGTDQGLYVSLTDGKSWELISGNLPNVSVYDLLVHPGEKELVIGTHGRSIYVMDVKPLQTLQSDKKLAVFDTSVIKLSKQEDTYAYIPRKPQTAHWLYYLSENPAQPVKAEVLDSAGKAIRRLSVNARKGFDTLVWDLKDEQQKTVKPGNYKVKITAGNETAESQVKIQ
jgi:photosystem II stability/assembly factor-like uncharacterized protein